MSIAEVDGLSIKLDLYQLVAAMDQDARMELIDLLACNELVMNEVVNQILDGVTTLGSHGPRGVGGNADAWSGINGARMRIAKAASDVAAQEIASLREQIIRERELGRKGWDAYHEVIGRGRQ